MKNATSSTTATEPQVSAFGLHAEVDLLSGVLRLALDEHDPGEAVIGWDLDAKRPWVELYAPAFERILRDALAQFGLTAKDAQQHGYGA